MTTTDTRRAAYTLGLRQLADTLDTNPAIPPPHSIDSGGLTFFIHRELDQALAIRALMTRPVITRDPGDFPIKITGDLGEFYATIHVRDKIALDAGAVPAEPPLVPALAALVNPVTLAAVSS